MHADKTKVPAPSPASDKTVFARNATLCVISVASNIRAMVKQPDLPSIRPAVVLGHDPTCLLDAAEKLREKFPEFSRDFPEIITSGCSDWRLWKVRIKTAELQLYFCSLSLMNAGRPGNVLMRVCDPRDLQMCFVKPAVGGIPKRTFTCRFQDFQTGRTHMTGVTEHYDGCPNDNSISAIYFDRP